MANYDSSPERRFRSKDKARDKVVAADKDKVIRAAPRQRRALIKAQARDKEMAADGVAAVVVEIRISKNVSGEVP